MNFFYILESIIVLTDNVFNSEEKYYIGRHFFNTQYEKNPSYTFAI